MATEAPQRHWRALCPNCGAPVPFASAASASAICSFCRSTLLREGDALRRIGVSAELIEDYSPLQLGAAGRFAGASFTIVGRLQLSYAEGSWNEWHALFDSGKSAWLSEDNGSFVMAFEAGLQEPAPPAAALHLSERLALAGRGWTVAALTRTTLAAGQGELPRQPALGQQFLVAELRNAENEVGSLEYSQPDAPQWSVGRPVRIEDLAMTGLRADSSATLASRALPCPSCGASLQPKLGATVSLSCPQCCAVVDLSQGVGAELTHFAQAHGGDPQIALGSVGSLAWAGGKPVPWQIVGYQERHDIPEAGSEDDTTFWREYLLFNKTEGFVFLVDAEDGWSLVRPLTGAPAAAAGSSNVEWQGRMYQRKYSYTASTSYVLGEFYWQVKRDERALVIDYEAPAGGGKPKALLSCEQTGTELSWSQGLALDAAAVASAFRLAPDNLAALERDAGPVLNQGKLVRMVVITLFVLLGLFIVLLPSCSRDQCQAYADSFGANSAEYQQCRRSHSGGGYFGRSGGSYGGYSSGGGGHK